MTTAREINNTLRCHLGDLRQRYGIKRIGLFGSYARGEQHPESDIDLLVEFVRPIGFIQFMRLEGQLEVLLGGKVDLVTRKALKPHIGRRILDEVQYVQ